MDTDAHAGELDLLVGLIAGIENSAMSFADAGMRIPDRICEAVCRSTKLTRAVMFLHDPTIGVSRPAGSHGVDEAIIASVAATLEEMPLAQRVLAEDRVIEVSRNLEFELPARYAGMAGITTITCAPVAAGGNWLGVIVADQGGTEYSLSEDDHKRVHTLGRLAAVAATVEESITNREQRRSLDSRIAMIREIHDQVVQRLFGVSLAMGSDGRLTLDEQHRCGEEITALLGQLRAALARPVSDDVPPDAGGSRSFHELVEWFAESDSVDLYWQEGVEVPAHLEAMARSAVVEALRNAEKHSDGGMVQIRVAAEDGTLSVEVGNDGIGRAAGEPSSGGGGIGLRLLTLEALQQDALVEFGPVGDDRWRFRLLAPTGPQP